MPVWHVFYRSRSHLAVQSVPTQLTQVALFFPFILALSGCLVFIQHPPVINAIASNAAVTHKLHIPTQGTQQRHSSTRKSSNSHPGPMVSKPLTNTTRMRAGDLEAIKTIKLLSSDQYISTSPLTQASPHYWQIASRKSHCSTIIHVQYMLHASWHTYRLFYDFSPLPPADALSPSYCSRPGNRSSSKGSFYFSHIATINRTEGLLLLLVQYLLSGSAAFLSHWCTLTLQVYSDRTSRQIVFQPLPPLPTVRASQPCRDIFARLRRLSGHSHRFFSFRHILYKLTKTCNNGFFF